MHGYTEIIKPATSGNLHEQFVYAYEEHAARDRVLHKTTSGSGHIPSGNGSNSRSRPQHRTATQPAAITSPPIHRQIGGVGLINKQNLFALYGGVIVSQLGLWKRFSSNRCHLLRLLRFALRFVTHGVTLRYGSCYAWMLRIPPNIDGLCYAVTHPHTRDADPVKSLPWPLNQICILTSSYSIT